MNVQGRAIVRAMLRLASDDPHERARARRTLETIGRPATWYLIEAVATAPEPLRHEALRVLGGLADPDAADTFVRHLADEDSACRWLAAEGLVALGDVGLERALELLLAYPGTEEELRGVHHVLSGLARRGYGETVWPVLRAFQGMARASEVPAAALAARNRWRRARLRAGAWRRAWPGRRIRPGQRTPWRGD